MEKLALKLFHVILIFIIFIFFIQTSFFSYLKFGCKKTLSEFSKGEFETPFPKLEEDKKKYDQLIELANLEAKADEESPIREDSLEHDHESSDQQDKYEESESSASADMTVNSPSNMIKVVNLASRPQAGFQPLNLNHPLNVHDSNYSQIDSYNLNQENDYENNNGYYRRNRNFINNPEISSMNLSTLI